MGKKSTLGFYYRKNVVDKHTDVIMAEPLLDLL